VDIQYDFQGGGTSLLKLTEEFFQELEEFRMTMGIDDESHPLYKILMNSQQILSDQQWAPLWERFQDALVVECSMSDLPWNGKGDYDYKEIAKRLHVYSKLKENLEYADNLLMDFRQLKKPLYVQSVFNALEYCKNLKEIVERLKKELTRNEEFFCTECGYGEKKLKELLAGTKEAS